MIYEGFRGFLELFFKINSYCTARSHVSRLSMDSFNKKKAATQGHKNKMANNAKRLKIT
jgi:hypothetical protein